MKTILSIILFISLQIVVHGQTSDTLTAWTIADEMPHFPGGEDSLKSFLKRNLVYPAIYSKTSTTNLEPTFYFSFIVMEDGRVVNIKGPNIVGYNDQEFKKEAYRVMRLMPLWVPGKQFGRAIKVQTGIGIHFTKPTGADK